MTLTASLVAPPLLGPWPLARPDLAEQAVEGLIPARAYRPTTAFRCAGGVADLLDTPDPAADRIDQLVHGEVFDVLEAAGDFAWGRARRDGVVGFVRRDALLEGAPLPTHRVRAVSAEVPGLGVLPMNALVRADGPSDALAPIDEFEADPAAVAERFLGAPHALGGRTAKGLDCCGLVQQALYACGFAGPRYAGEQAEAGRPVRRADAGRGDLVVWGHAEVRPWRGHSGLMLDGERLIHATGHHGAVVVEPLAEAAARYAADGFSEPVFRRAGPRPI